MTKEEFCARFASELVRLGGEQFDDGESVADYARNVASTYWDDPTYRADGPEACAEADLDGWE